LADEPTGNWIGKIRNRFLSLLENHIQGCSVLMATHNVDAGGSPYRKLYLKNGMVTESIE
jgi:ABC-type ATPase involved in cell division